jgi:hypothetical protein
MGLLNEFFLAKDDDDARRALPDGPTAGGFAEVVPSGGFTNLEIELLEQAVTGKKWSPAPISVLSEDNAPEGPWVVGFPGSVTDALLEVGQGELQAVAGRWAGFNELKGADPSGLADLLADLIDLVAAGVGSRRSPYLWICL